MVGDIPCSPRFGTTDGDKRMILCSGLTAFFLSIAMLYQMSPFFQSYAKTTVGADAGTVGLIFAVLPASSFVFSIPTGKLIVRFGEQTMLIAGLLLLSISSLMFGLSRSIRGWMFWRAVQGASTAPIYSSISCMFAKAFTGPGEFARVNGLQEAMSNIGFVVSPLMGGIMFEWGGFVLPFAVSAVCHLIFVVFTLIRPCRSRPAIDGAMSGALLEKDEAVIADSVPHAQVKDMMFADFMLILPAGVIIPGIFGAMDPVLALHLRACLGNIDSGTIGALMSVVAIPCIPLAMAVPTLMQRVSPDWIVSAGMMLFAVTQVSLGLTDPDKTANLGLNPTFAVGGQVQWVFQVALFVGLGVASSFGWTPVLPDLMEKAGALVSRQHSLSNEEAMAVVSPCVSSLFNAAAAIGEAAGPVLGGVVYARYGFSGTYVVFGFACAMYSLMIVCYRLRNMHDEPPHRCDSFSLTQKLRSVVTLPETLTARQSEFLRSPQCGSRRVSHDSHSSAP